MTRALVLMSGGLDSLLAARLLQEQGLEVIGLNFVSPFFTGVGPRGQWPRRAARALGMELRVIALGRDYLEVLRRPRHGWGRGLNPCEDCHCFMLRRAGELLEPLGAELVATGEVLGQRPKSQQRPALERIARESGLGDRLLRPLSAQLLEPTAPERLGLVDRSCLLDISGRSRRRQLRLAAQWGLHEYSAPAGGCSLTDPNVARRLHALLEEQPRPGSSELRLCLYGRHLLLRPGLKLVLGRNQRECELLERLAGKRLLLEPSGVTGPLGVVCGRPGPGELELLARLVLYYTPKAESGTLVVAWRQGASSGTVLASSRPPAEQVERLRL